MNFSAIANQFLSELSDSIKPDSCPDQYVGKINNLHPQLREFRRQNMPCRPRNEKYVILILESPHIKEYLGEIAPAKWTTGKNIRSYLRTMTRFRHYRNYGLVLMNAVPYQCSLGLPTECVRDLIFNRVWSQGGKKYFTDRLKQYWRPGDIVANCCTKGESTEGESELRVLVQRAIKQALPAVIPIRRPHPSSWHYGESRNAEWELPPSNLLNRTSNH